MRRQALKCVLSEKARQQRLVFVDSLDTVDGKTRSMVDLLNSLGVSGSALMVTHGALPPVVKAAHNLKKIWTLPVAQLNAQELLSRETVIMTLEAARWAEETLAVEPHGRRGSGGSQAVEALVEVSTEETEQAVSELEPVAEESPTAGQVEEDQAVDSPEESLEQTDESEETDSSGGA